MSETFAKEVSYSNQFIEYLTPEVFLTMAICYCLWVAAIKFNKTEQKYLITQELTEIVNAACVFVVVLYVIQLTNGKASSFFDGYMFTSSYVVTLKLVTVLSTLFILRRSSVWMKNHSRHLVEYPILIALATLFMLLLVGSGHLISAFLTLVGFSLNLYVLILFDAPWAVAREAGIKYFYLSTFSSGLMLYGIFLLFLVVGTGHFNEIGQILATSPEVIANGKALLQYAVLFLLVGVFFKLSAFPGHLWAAEVYEGSPDPITAFFMLPVKVTVMAFLLQLLTTALEPVSAFWQPLIVISAVFSMIWGCFAALAEKNTKRFLAYTSINQIGFLLLGVATGSFEGYRATILYLFIYVTMSMGFLHVFLGTWTQGDRSPMRYLTDFYKLTGRNNFSWEVRWPLSMVLLSMAGIPPLAGFFGKYYLLLHAQEQELYGLVIVALATSLVSTFYYLRVIKIFWLDESHRFASNYYVNYLSHSGETSHTASKMMLIPSILYGFILFSNWIIGFSDNVTQSLFAPLETALTAEISNGLVSSLILFFAGITYLGFIRAKTRRQR